MIKVTLIYNYFNKYKDCNMFCCETNKSIENIGYSYIYSCQKIKILSNNNPNIDPKIGIAHITSSSVHADSDSDE